MSEVTKVEIKEQSPTIENVADTQAEVKTEAKAETSTTKTKDGVYKINLNQEPNVQEQENNEHGKDGNEESNQASNEEGQKLQAGNEEEVVVEITGQKEAPVMQKETVETVIESAVENKIDLPENIQKVVEFMNETGGSLEDYVRLNADYSNVDEKTLLKQYLQQTKSHLDGEEIDFLIEDAYLYDEDFDDEKEVKRKKLAYKEAVKEAKGYLEGLKGKYYDEVKLGSKLLPEQQKAIEFYNQYSKESKESEEQAKMKRDRFIAESEKLFSNEFKGFEFELGDKKFRFNVKDAAKVKEEQADIVSAFSSYLGEDGTLKDAKGYHRALFAARNADSLATHFYEQGKAEAVKQMVAESKNIDMNPRNVNNGVLDTGKAKVKVVNGDSAQKVKLKLKNY